MKQKRAEETEKAEEAEEVTKAEEAEEAEKVDEAEEAEMGNWRSGNKISFVEFFQQIINGIRNSERNA